MQNAMFSHLHSVIIHQLDEGWDRRGRHVTFLFEAVPNQDYQRPQCINLVRTLTSFLAPHYSNEPFHEYDFSEINECWIDYTWRKPELAEVVVRHKYWSNDKVLCFNEMVIALAHLYNAIVIDNRPEKIPELGTEADHPGHPDHPHYCECCQGPCCVTS